MPESTTSSTIAIHGSLCGYAMMNIDASVVYYKLTGRDDRWPDSDQHYETQNSANNKPLAAERLKCFIAGEAPMPTHTHGHTKMSYVVDISKGRMSAKLAAFDQAFNDSSNDGRQTRYRGKCGKKNE